jgi:hypothetical protein
MLSVCYTTSNSRKYCLVGIANQKLVVYLPLVALTAALVTFPALLFGNEHLKTKNEEWKDLLRLLNRFDDTDGNSLPHARLKLGVVHVKRGRGELTL